MAEFAEMPEELRQFVLAECAFAQVQATEELRATMLQIAKLTLSAGTRSDRVGAEDDAESADGDADGDEVGADGDAENADGDPPEAA